MKTKPGKRLLSILLSCIMLLSLMPTHAHAWDTVIECEYCGSICGDDYICSGGDHCSAESGRDCYDEHHCSGCGECQDNKDFCENCGMCVECAQSNGEHCPDCGICVSEVTLCGMCYRCADCGGECSEGIEACNACLECHRAEDVACLECDTCYSQESLYCPECGLCGINCVQVCEECAKCEECAAEDGLHCPNCYECYSNADPCPVCGFCSSCTEFCDTCGMCVDCAVVEGLHCPDCQECVGEDEQCSLCGLCMNCAGGYCEFCLMCYDCAVDMEEHCPGCYECYEYYLPCKGDCYACENCADDWCETCEMCVVCGMENNTHCPDCGTCTKENGCQLCYRCADCGDECSDGLDSCGTCLLCHFEYDAACEQCYMCFIGPVEEQAQCLGSCGLCFECSTEWCEDCHMCEDCAVEEQCHCQECYNCLVGDEQVCEECKRCSGCCIICEECNMCEDCGVENDTHCPDCSLCTKEDGCQLCFRCKDCGDECSEGLDSCGACLLCHLEEGGACEGCNYCFLSPDREEVQCHGSCGLCKECATTWCEDCKMCEECAIEEQCHCQICGGCLVDAGGVCEGCNRCHNCFDDWCSTCLLCVECAIEDEKHCPDCGICAQENDCCLLCQRCAECGGECSEGIICGACLECHLDEGVACPDCGQCFINDDSTQCQECGYCSVCVISWCDACQMCGACAMGDGLHCPECNTCYEEAEHTCIGCGRCSACFEDWCDTCELCIECAAADGLHCPDCMTCHEDVDSHCDNCGKCSDCVDAQCPDCGWCGDCVTLCGDCGYCENDAVICPDCGEACSECSAVCGYCGSCENCEELCVNCGGYCTGCAALCGGCGYCGEECADRCTQCGQRCSNCATVCHICWMCEECCKSNSQAAGCSHNVCIRGDEWDSHWAEFHTSSEHAHVYTKYSRDASGHWQVCKVSTCGERTATEAHTFGPWRISRPATETSTGLKSRLCTVCEYWETEEIPLLDHVHQLTLVPAKAATCTQNGNKAYYTCTCGKWFVDEAGKKEITDKSTVVLYGGHTASGWRSDASNHWKVCVTAGCGAVLADTKAAHEYGGDSVCDICGYDKGTTYKVTEGAGGTWTKGASVPLVFKANGSITRFTGIKVDDAAVDPAMYTAVNGSTMVTLKPEYLESLSLGLHTLTFVYNNGKTSTYFTILAAGADEPDHTHEVTLVPETAPTCTASGRKAHYICGCGKLFADKNAAAEITDLSSILIPATGHDYRWIIDQMATADEAGSKHQECRYCHDVKAPVAIPALGSGTPHVHAYTQEVIPPTCTEQGYTEHICSCGSNFRDNYVDPTGHVDADNSGKCDVCASNVAKVLTGISITTGPDKTTYTAGQSFRKDGMVVTAAYSDGSTAPVTTYTYSPSGALTTADTQITIHYTEGGVTQQAVQPITVNPGSGSTGGGSSGSGSSGGNGSSQPTTSEKALDDIWNAKPGDTVKIELQPGKTTVGGEVFDEAAGKDITLEIDAGNGLVWTVNGLDIPVSAHVEDLNLGVSLGGHTIPVSVLNVITGTEKTLQLSIAHDGPFGFTLTLTANLGRENAGYWANLYWYNEDEDALEFMYATTIAADGTTAFPFDHASDYAIIIDLHSRAPMTLSFTDVPEGSYYEDAVIWAVEKGVTGGTSPTTFTPDGICTRAQAVTFLWRAAGSPAPRSTAMDFADVPAGSYYYGAVLWAVENGITNGTSDTAFGPGQNCSRAQIVTFLYRAAGSPAVSGSAAFTDVASDAYYAAAVKWAEANGITGGIGGGLFGSDSHCTRAQIVTFLYRYMGK